MNFGIIPLTFTEKHDYAEIAQGETAELDVKGLRKSLCLKNVTKGTEIRVQLSLSEREKETIRAGGKLSAIKAKHARNRAHEDLLPLRINS